MSAQGNRICTLGSFLLGLLTTAVGNVFASDAAALELMVPMRDGVKLRTVVYLPAGEEKCPAILTRTPYARDKASLAKAPAGVKKGIAYVVQFSRGRCGSEGVFYPYRDEAADGEDCLKWLLAQDWSNGRVAMEGASYLGHTQWYAALSSLPGLVGISPTVAFCETMDSPRYMGGAFLLQGCMGWGLNMCGVKSTSEIDYKKLLWHLPTKEIDVAAGLGQVNYWRDWLEHSEYGPYWKEQDIKGRHRLISAPAFITGGWFDMFANGTLKNFMEMRSGASTEKARKFTRCVIGPWTHGCKSSGEIDYGPNADDSKARLARTQFLESLLKAPDVDPLPEEPPLKYFMMGSNEWRSSECWPPNEAVMQSFFLHSSGHANGNSGDGALKAEAPQKNEPPDSYIYDPKNPVPTNGGSVFGGPAGSFDQRKLEERKDVLVFSTEPLQEDVEVVGNIAVKLFASSDAPDTDFTAKLIDVYPDGRAFNLCDGIIRARYRKSMEKPELLTTGEIFEYNIDCWGTANSFKKGHKIRVEISSSNFPRFDRNPNTGRKISEETELKEAKQTIYHDSAHPSRLLLPVIRPGYVEASTELHSKGK